jgi:ribose/xylose/arabinose/galactoside ABC-type transport system permease subunit
MMAVTFGVESPVLGVLVAIGAGVVVGTIQGTIIAKLGISSVPVTLGGYIALLGLTSVVSGGQSIAYENLAAGVWLEQQIGEVFSPRSLITIAAFLIVAGLLFWTRMGRDLRAVGGDRRAARAAGVRTDRVLVITFIATASIAALGGALLSYSIATAKPDPGTQPLVIAVTGVLLGGVTLAGGRGPVLGIAAGTFSLALLQELFVIQATPAYVSELVLGGLLVLVVAVDAPDLKRKMVAMRSRMKQRSAPAGPAPGRGP